jgi:hypothetical protein
VVGVGREDGGRDDVDRQHDPPRDRTAGPGRCDHVLLEQRLADLVALRLEEGEAHAAADEQLVDLGQQRLDHRQLVGDLGAAEHHHVRLLGVLGDRASTSTSRSTSRRRSAAARPHVVHAGVLAVHRAERVVDVALGERGQLSANARARRRPCWSRRR